MALGTPVLIGHIHSTVNQAANVAYTGTTTEATASDDDLLAGITGHGTSIADAFAITLGGLTWAKVVTSGIQSARRTSVFRARGAVASGSTFSVTLGDAAISATACDVDIVKVNGADASSPVVQSRALDSSSTNPAVALLAAPDAANGVFLFGSIGVTDVATADTGFTLLGSGTHASPNCRATAVYDVTAPGQTPGFNVATSGAWTAAALELRAAGGAPAAFQGWGIPL